VDTLDIGGRGLRNVKTSEKNLKLKSGKWIVDISFTKPNGKLKRVRAAFPTKTEAKAHLDLVRGQKASRRLGIEVPDEKRKDVLFDDYARSVLANQADLRPNSIKSMRKHLNNLLRSDCFKGKMLSALTTAEISKYHTERGIERKMAANAELWFLRMVLQKAIDLGLLAKNPAAGVKRFRQDKTRLRILTDAEAALLLNAAGPKLVPLIRLLLTTGMRPHEAFALHFEYDGWDVEKKRSKAVVDIGRKVISIPHELSKNHKDREVPLSPELVSMFHQMPRNPESSKVFPWGECPKAFNEAVRAAKLKGVSMYTLKHSAASRMIKAGVDIVTVAEVLGHQDIKQTIRYCHSDPQSKRDAIAKVSQIYFKDAQVADAPASQAGAEALAS